MGTPTNPVGRYLSTARQRRGWTQTDLAKHAGIKSRTTIQTLENGGSIRPGLEGSVERVLGWPLGTLDEIRKGARPNIDELDGAVDHVAISNGIRARVGTDAAIEYLQRVIAQQAETQDQAAVARAGDAQSKESERS